MKMFTQNGVPAAVSILRGKPIAARTEQAMPAAAGHVAYT